MNTYQEAINELQEALLDGGPAPTSSGEQLDELVISVPAAVGMAGLAALAAAWGRHKVKAAAKEAVLNSRDRRELSGVLSKFTTDIEDVSGDLRRLARQVKTRTDMSVFDIRYQLIKKMKEMNDSIKVIATSLKKVEGVAVAATESAEHDLGDTLRD